MQLRSPEAIMLYQRFNYLYAQFADVLKALTKLDVNHPKDLLTHTETVKTRLRLLLSVYASFRDQNLLTHPNMENLNKIMQTHLWNNIHEVNPCESFERFVNLCAGLTSLKGYISLYTEDLLKEKEMKFLKEIANFAHPLEPGASERC